MHEAFYKSTMALLFVLLATQGYAGPCSVFMPNVKIEVTGGKCELGTVCYLKSCQGIVNVPLSAPAVQILFTNPQDESDMEVVPPGEKRDLATLATGGEFTSSIKQLVSAVFSLPGDRQTGGRHALGDGDSHGAPSGMIAVPANGALVFAARGNGGGGTYILTPSNKRGVPQQFSVDGSGVIHIPAQLLQPEQSYRGGFQGATNVPFSVASQEELSELYAKLGAVSDKDPVSARYRKALMLFDNGFTWNAHQMLDGTDQAL